LLIIYFNLNKYLKIDKQCNPGLLGIVRSGFDSSTHASSLANITTTTTITTPQMQRVTNQILDTPSIVSLVLWFLIVLYSSFTSASKGNKLINIGNPKEKTSLTDSERECEPFSRFGCMHP
jgi:hypothetical protein